MENKYKRTMCNVKGTMAEPFLGHQGKYHKFCALCGYQMIGEGGRLKKHCNIYHDGENNGFLKYGEIPPKPIYINFDKYLEGSAEHLVFDS